MTAAHIATFEHPIVPGPADIDFMGHVNNASYLRFVQDAVLAHWRALAPATAVARHLWVAIRHEIDYRLPAFPGDTLVALHAFERAAGVRAYSVTRIMRGADLIAEARSCWCSIDAASLRPVRLARDLIARFLPPAD